MNVGNVLLGFNRLTVDLVDARHALAGRSMRAGYLARIIKLEHTATLARGRMLRRSLHERFKDPWRLRYFEATIKLFVLNNLLDLVLQFLKVLVHVTPLRGSRLLFLGAIGAGAALHRCQLSQNALDLLNFLDEHGLAQLAGDDFGSLHEFIQVGDALSTSSTVVNLELLEALLRLELRRQHTQPTRVQSLHATLTFLLILNILRVVLHTFAFVIQLSTGSGL